MKTKKEVFHYGSDHLDVDTALALTMGRLEGQISVETAERIRAAEAVVRHIAAGDVSVYGINTGFGSLCDTRISAKDTELLQHNILRSHSCGMGPAVSQSIVRLMMILKVHALAQGHSGVRRETLDRIIWHIDNRAIPVVPSQGSVGASGDLAPLAHLFLPLIGRGEVWWKDEKVPTARMLAQAGLEPLQLGPKEGLALINGTQFITAHALTAWDRMRNCLDHADIIGAMSVEALLGSTAPFSEELHNLRPYRGTLRVARRLRNLLKGSEMVLSHAHCGRVQDPYSLRCMPQVHGASRNAWAHLGDMLDVEMNAVTDNPLIFAPDRAVSGGNFHGQPLALPLDYATLAASELGNISDRRSYLLLDGEAAGLPKLLMKSTGLNSGFMIPQYVSAALVSENKSLCFPPSADSVPTSLGQEDHVSMGSISARRLHTVLDNLERILAVELVLAAQGFDFHRPMKSSPVLEACHARVRRDISHAEADREFYVDLEAAAALIRSRELVEISRRVATESGFSLDDEEDLGKQV
ncbi:MAG: histidine ammonia-lyase [Candidatus Aminicenantes bacterium]|nr:histidine ammonia-lyase [Candidatus Aminicenantes bacterium]